MKGYREAELANFNCTFGKENEEMGLYFMDVIYPALREGYSRSTDNATFYIDNVEIVEIAGLGYALIGTHIYQTILKGDTDYDQEEGITDSNEELETSPYSAFVILLKNHRMIHIPNGKGSPLLKWLGTTIRIFTEKYIEEKSLDTPSPNINIVAIPSEKSIEQQIKNMARIRSLEFKFFPLNGDIDNSSFFSTNRKAMEDVKSKSMINDIKEPKDLTKVSKLIKAGKDLVSTIVKGFNKSGNEVTLTDNTFKEKIPLDLPEQSKSISENIIYASNELSGLNVLKDTSVENNKIYDEHIKDKAKESMDLDKQGNE